MVRRRINLRFVDVEAVLHHLGVQVVRKDHELYAKCPHPEHNEKKPSWHIRAKLGDSKNAVFHCWSCKWSGNVISLVATVRKIKLGEAAAWVAKYQKEPVKGRPTTDADLLRGLHRYEPPEIGFEFPDHRGNLQPFTPEPIVHGTPCSDYLTGRWFGPEIIERCGLLDWPEKRRVVIPIELNGKMISWVARSYNGGQPKTLAPKRAPKLWELIGIDEVDRSNPVANLVEGWADRARLMQIRVPNPCALCASRISEQQAELLLWARRIVVWIDGDKAGEVLANNTVAWFGAGREIAVVPFPSKTDPAHYPPPEVCDFQPLPWNEYRR